MLNRFKLACEDILSNMDMFSKIIDREGNESEDIEWSDFRKYPSEEYKYACLMKEVEQGTMEGYVQFEVPFAVRNIEVPEDRLHMAQDIVKHVTRDADEYVVMFSNHKALMTFTMIETPVENFYLKNEIPWEERTPEDVKEAEKWTDEPF